MFRMDKKWNWKILLGLLLASFFLAAMCYRFYNTEIYMNEHASILPDLKSIGKASLTMTLETKITKEKLIMLAQVIQSAHKHARGSKTSDYLNAAVSIMNSILKDIEVEPGGLYKRHSNISTSVCPETFMGGNFGFPLYYNGFVTKTCENAVPMHKLMTVIKYVDTSKNDSQSFDDITKFITSVNNTYSNVTVLIATIPLTFSSHMELKYPWAKVITSKSSEGSALNRLIEQVKTPYVLVARNMKELTNDTRLERLIGEIESLGVAVAGGAFRDSNGYWRRGCYQTVYRNFTLRYIEGYDESFHECVFCDYMQGPFVTTTTYLKQNKFQSLNDGTGLYEDWLLRNFENGHEMIVCPDSMFNVHDVPQSSSNWNSFLKTWNLFKIFTPTGLTFRLECEGHAISSEASIALSPCVLKLNNEAVKLIMRTCETTGVICELQEGTAFGAVKMGKAFPWEQDFDIRFLATNCTKCKKLEHALQKEGLKFDGFATTCCARKLKFGERINVGMHYKGYYGDFTGHAVMDSDLLTKVGMAPTKVLLDGQWVNVPRNPGMFVRNRYGKEIYQHAEHWRYTGGKNKHHRMNYTTNVFLPCKYPGRHDCLDRYNADGNLQFTDLLP